MSVVGRYERIRGAVAVALTVGAGATGAALRYWERLVAFEPDTGLFISGTKPTPLLIALSVVVALALLSLVRQGGSAAPYERLFAARGDAYLFGAVAAAMLLVASGVMTFYPFLTGGTQKFTQLILALFSPVAAAGVILGARNCRRDPAANRRSLVLLLPAFYVCYWLVLAYEARAADPVVPGYLYELLAVICVLLALYHIAGCAFEKPRPARCLYFCLMGVYFSMVTLADGHGAAALLRFAFAIVYLLSAAVLLVRRRADWAREEAPGEPPERENA
ncbi:MAG TPA: hypothetical protein PK597_03280 [Oscillospiraceae bacterium]|nr:hypothetical protein [Oscillospiraceae bacterium]